MYFPEWKNEAPGVLGRESSLVTLLALDTETEVRYKIVGEDEADIKADKISVMSPVARALIGKEEGDAVTVATPDGEHEYEIDRVEHV